MFESVERAQRPGVQIRPALGGSEIDHHNLVGSGVPSEAAQIVGDQTDGFAVTAGLDLVAPIDVPAERSAADRGPGPHSPQAGRAVAELFPVEDAVLLGGRAEILIHQVPAAEHEVAIVGEAWDGQLGERQAVQPVRACFQHLDSGDGGRGDGPA